MDVSIIIVNWNAKDFVEKCLRSLEQTGFAGSMEIILVDNASTDGSEAMVREKFPS
jgi:GT2 family glycosyltransferase